MTSEPIAKRAKLESEPVCIVVNAITDTDLDKVYGMIDSDLNIYVYFVDLKEEEKIERASLHPAFQITGLTTQTIAVVSKSTLYIFTYEESSTDFLRVSKAYKYSFNGTEDRADIKLVNCQQIIYVGIGVASLIYVGF